MADDDQNPPDTPRRYEPFPGRYEPFPGELNAPVTATPAKPDKKGKVGSIVAAITAVTVIMLASVFAMSPHLQLAFIVLLAAPLAVSDMQQSEAEYRYMFIDSILEQIDYKEVGFIVEEKYDPSKYLDPALQGGDAWFEATIHPGGRSPLSAYGTFAARVKNEMEYSHQATCEGSIAPTPNQSLRCVDGTISVEISVEGDNILLFVKQERND